MPEQMDLDLQAEQDDKKDIKDAPYDWETAWKNHEEDREDSDQNPYTGKRAK